jgi:hypothetical protein
MGLPIAGLPANTYFKGQAPYSLIQQRPNVVYPRGYDGFVSKCINLQFAANLYGFDIIDIIDVLCKGN